MWILPNVGHSYFELCAHCAHRCCGLDFAHCAVVLLKCSETLAV